MKRFTLKIMPLVALLVIGVGDQRHAYGTVGALPRIDPSGQRLFVWDNQPYSKYQPVPGRPHPRNMMFLKLAPAKVIAPVGSEVVLVGSICGPDGYMHAGERVEWMIAPGGVGQFVSLGDRSFLDCLASPKLRPQKLDNSYAVGTTSARYIALTRGTPTYDDDVPVQKGQAYITVTSPVEGASFVTAFAPNVYGWDQRQRTSTIYWVDAQWTLPPPSTNPIGTTHAFTTSVTRQTDHSPLVGWLVRYEITGGPAANFAPNGGQVIEVPTNDLGQATAEIVQQQGAAGSNAISVQIIRPAELSGSYGQRLVVGNGSTMETWAASGSLSLRTTGPSQATVGSTVTYRIDVSNPSPLSVRQAVVTDQIPAGLTFVSSTPPAQPAGGRLEWQLGDVNAGQSVVIEADFRADKAGTISNCAALSSAEGLSAQSCATTTVMATALPPQAISVTMSAPPTATVGQDVEFVAVVTNRSTMPTPPLTIVDRFDPSLQNAAGPSPIEQSVNPIQPGQSQTIRLTLRPMQAGQLCNTVEVQTNDRTILGTTQACVTAAAQAAAPTVRPTITVKKTGPQQLAAGQTANFQIEIANVGQVPATQVRLADNYDSALEPTSATDGHNWVGSDLVWVLDTLPPGRSFTYEVRCLCNAPAARACNRATVTTAEGVTANDDACLVITPTAAQATPAVPGKLTIDVADLVEPVAAGRNTTYQVKVTNAGQAADSQITLTVTLPPEMTPLGVGPGGITNANINGKSVNFAPVQALAPGETLTFQVQARADVAGQARVQAQVKSAGVPAGVLGEELTTILAQ
ncbi:MAG TPA: DUF11 domain-containing protein [Pirellulales bacterium]